MESKAKRDKPKWCNLSDIYYHTSTSKCFGHHYAHHQENKNGVLLHMVFCTGCAGCGCVQLGRKLCALCEGYCSTQCTQCTQCTQLAAQLHTTTASNQCRIPYAVILSLVLLKMGIMMSETCWDRSLVINTRLFSSCWFLSLQPTFMMHGHKNLKRVHKSTGTLINDVIKRYTP